MSFSESLEFEFFSVKAFMSYNFLYKFDKISPMIVI